jgi:hypothetical protein
MQTYSYGALIVGLSVALSVLGLLLVHRRFPHETRHPNNEVAGFFIAVVGVVYAVLVAFMVIVVWEQLDAARAAAEQEGADLATFIRTARALPDPVGGRIREAAGRYAQAVIDEEWTIMAEGRSSPRAVAAMDEMWQVLTTYEPRNAREEALYATSLDRLDDISDGRQQRLLAARNGLPGIMWALLVGGGIITVAFTYFFSTPSFRAQLVMTAFYTALIAFALYLIAAIDHPFSGAVHVGPEAFELALEAIR